MGMFDFSMDGLDDPKKQALLMMAAGLLSPQDGRMGKGSQFASALSQGLQGGLLGYNQASQNKRRNALTEQEAKMREMQMADMQRGQQYNQAFGEQISGKPAIPYNDSVGDQPPQANIQNAVAPGFNYQELAKIDGRKAWQDKMAYDAAQIKETPYDKPKPENYTPESLAKYMASKNPADLVPYQAPAKPKYSGGETREIKSGSRVITQEYDGKAWKTIDTAPAWKPDAHEKGPAAPSGFRYAASGNLEAIPGGPADTKIGEKAEAMRKREEGALARADMVLGNVKEAIKESGVLTAGPVGAIARNIPGTGGYNLNKKLDAIRSNIGFAELQAMREASPTGGALGQVAVQELNMLQSVLGSLDTAQSPAQLEKNLYAIEKHYSNWKNAVKKSSKPDGEWSIQRVP